MYTIKLDDREMGLMRELLEYATSEREWSLGESYPTLRALDLMPLRDRLEQARQYQRKVAIATKENAREAA